MIQDAAAKEKLLQEWHFVRRSQGILKSRAVASFGGGVIGMVGIYSEYYALLLVLGFSVLEHTLEAIADQGTFKPKRWGLETLMIGAQTAGVKWQNYPAIDSGRQKRNDLAHRQVIPVAEDTFRMLDEIEAELIGWDILAEPVNHDFSVSVHRTS
jgi:hypothetical protein